MDILLSSGAELARKDCEQVIFKELLGKWRDPFFLTKGSTMWIIILKWHAALLAHGWKRFSITQWKDILCMGFLTVEILGFYDDTVAPICNFLETFTSHFLTLEIKLTEHLPSDTVAPGRNTKRASLYCCFLRSPWLDQQENRRTNELYFPSCTMKYAVCSYSPDIDFRILRRCLSCDSCTCLFSSCLRSFSSLFKSVLRIIKNT